MHPKVKKCRICSKKLVGRKDKIFCSVKCKNYYHVNLRKATVIEALQIDRILHRNRSILLEIMGKKKMQMQIPRLLLEQKKFRFNYLTHYTVNSKGKTYHWIYDFAWMSFSNDEVLLVRKRNDDNLGY